MVVLTLPPCSPLPVVTPGGVAVGAGGSTILGVAVGGTPGAPVNAPPLTTITAGLPFEVALAGRPVATVDTTPLPPAVAAALGVTPVQAGITSLLFDFGTAGAYGLGCGQSSKEAEGRVVALGKKGAAQASLTFTYRWCGPLVQCGRSDTTNNAFTVEACTGKGLQFVVVDASTFLSRDPCTESVVILNLQQYCPGPATVPATPPTIAACCQAPLEPGETTAMLACSSCPSSYWGPLSS